MHDENGHLTRASMFNMQREVKDAIGEIAKRYGFEVDSKVEVTQTTIKVASSGQLKDVDLADTPAGRQFKYHARRGGLDPDMLGKQILLGNGRSKQVFKIVGWNDRNWKNPVLIERVGDGKPFKSDAATVRNAMVLGA